MADKSLLILLCAVGLTALCGTLMGAIAIFGPNPQPAAIASFFDTLKYLFTVGGLALITLLGTIPRRSGTSKRQDNLPL